MLQKKILFRYLMLFVFLWGITSQIEAKDKHFIIQGIEYRLSKIVDNLYCAVDNLHPKQMKDSTSLVIPAYVSYKGKSYPVTFCSLGLNKSEEKVVKNIRYLTIPKTLRIGKHDFRNFTSLLSVSFEDGVERIGDFAFYQLPELHWVDLPNSIKEIGSYAFSECNKLNKIYLFNKNMKIGNGAFSNCKSLTYAYVNVHGVTMKQIFGDYKDNYLDTLDLGYRTVIEKNMVRDCTRLRKVRFEGTKRIEDGAFSGCMSLPSIELPKQLEYIGNYAFDNCHSLSKIVIPSKVTYIGDMAFAFCYKLTEIYGLTSKITIHNGVFDSWGETPFKSAFYTLKANNFEYGGLFKTFSEYAKPLIEEDIKNWQKKLEFEKQSEWKKRVTAVNQNLKVKELTKEYKSKYLNTNKRVDLRYILAAYDPENETFPVYIKNVDTLFIKVPIAQAPTFKEKWKNDVKITPNYDIVNDRAAIVSFSFKLGNNVYKSLNNYVPDQNLSANIDLPEIIVDVADNKVQTTPQSLQKAKTQPVAIIDRTIDKDIPVSSVNSSNTFAFIIGNENYQNVASVPFAVNDAKIFSEYCHKTLGLPKENIKVYIDATYGKILGALSTLKQISQAYKGDINVIFYYAGHGVPNEKNNEAYLLPADATPSMLEACLPLSGLYSSIGSIDAKQVIVFMDACFSGSRRENGMIVSARGVAIKPKKDIVTGNVVVFSAADGSETAYPYKEKGHGLFTYFLLKKLKESRGNVTLGDLADYVKTNVSQKSIVVNNKSQTPTISSSAQMQDVWRTMKLFRK